jgi:hypothetical protein
MDRESSGQNLHKHDRQRRNRKRFLDPTGGTTAWPSRLHERLSMRLPFSCLYAASAFDNEHARASDRMGNMLITILGMKDVAHIQPMDPLGAILPCMHVDCTVENHKYFRAVIDVPLVRLIGPMKSNGGVADALNIQGVPRSGAGKTLREDCAH